MLLEKMREAQGSERLAQSNESWVWTGTSTEFGSKGPFRFQFDGDGRFHRRSEGELGVTVMYDGKTGWRVDWSGISAPLELATLEQELLEVWIMTGSWLTRPDALEVLSVQPGVVDGLAERKPDERSDATGQVTIELRLSGGVETARLILDGETCLPLRLESSVLAGKKVLRLEQYEEVEGVRFPRRIVREVGGHVERVLTIDRVFRAEDRGHGEALYSNRPAAPEDTKFAASSGDVPIRFAPTGHVLVQPSLNGEEMDWFIFDTGAGSSGVGTTSPISAQLNPVGTSWVASIFGIEETPILRGQSFELGPLHLTNPTFFSMDLSPLEDVFGEPIGGIVGFDLLSRSVVELDLAEQRLTLHDPQDFALAEGEWQELWLQDNHPIVEAEFNGNRGLFRLDIGAAGGPHGNIIFHQPTVQRLALIDESDVETVDLGSQSVALGSLDSFVLAGRTFDRLDVAFALDEVGLFSDHHTAGNVGVGILQSFRIVFDYPHQRVALIPKP